MNRFDEMTETHAIYFPVYKSIVERASISGEPSNMLHDFVVGQIGSKKGIRGYMFRKMYELTGGDWKEIVPIIAAVEMHLASIYCFNVAADNKSGYDTPQKRETAFATRDIAFHLALKLISQSGVFGDKTRQLEDSFIETDETFYKGETLDVLANIYPTPTFSEEEIRVRYGIQPSLARETLEKFVHSSLDEKVLYRTYGINAAMFENMGRVVGILRGLSIPETNALTSFGRNYGLAMMIINDVQDYSLDLATETTREKSCSDVFSDLKERKITWPILYYLKNNDVCSVPFGNCDYHDYDVFRKLLSQNGVMKRTVLEAMAYSRMAVNSLHSFPDNNARKMIIDSAVSISKLSKYVTLLEQKYAVALIPSRREVHLRVQEIALM